MNLLDIWCGQAFDSNGRFKFKFGKEVNFDDPVDGLYECGAIALTPYGEMLVADSGCNRIQVFDSDGRCLFKFGSKGTGIGQFARPAGIAFNHITNQIVVADCGNHRICLLG